MCHPYATLFEGIFEVLTHTPNNVLELFNPCKQMLISITVPPVPQYYFIIIELLL